MGKYSGIVNSKNQTSKPENQKTLKVNSSKTRKPENIKSGNQQSMKTSNKESVKTGKPENQETVSEDMVNLSIKVPRRLRQKWVAESRLRGTTLTAIISDYLKTELGE